MTETNGTMIYACSGASDLGEITDRVARKLREKGAGKMSCLAALGALSQPYIDTAKTSGGNIVIDGCPVGCSKSIFELIGVKNTYYMLTEMGYVKGKTPPDEKVISDIADKIISGTVNVRSVKDQAKSNGSCGCGK
jgi:uncharacterized metal-binding protein